MEACDGEACLQSAATDETPDVLFDRQWAMNLLDEVFRQLQAKYGQPGREGLFRQLRPFIQGDHEEATHDGTARVLGTTAGTVKVTVHRLRRRFRELLRFQVLQTLANPLQVEKELRYWVAALRR